LKGIANEDEYFQDFFNNVVNGEDQMDTLAENEYVNIFRNYQ